MGRDFSGAKADQRVADAVSVDPSRGGRLAMLDGWRAISILLVMAAHLLPLGPSRFGLNTAVAALGMAIFFNLSGFLIVTILLRNQDVLAFAVKRLARILPLAWSVLAIVFVLYAAPGDFWLPNFLFYANLPPFPLLNVTAHFWSLAVEIQFYGAIALAVLLLGRTGLYLVVPAALAVTLLRIATGTDISIVTWLRVDEILAGGVLALLLHHGALRRLGRLPAWTFLLFAALFALSTQPALPWLNYARPYLCATMIGFTVVRAVPWLSPLLTSRPFGYLATVSYALYIFHHLFMWGWFDPDSKVQKYLRRPVAIALTFALAHLSTFHFERRFTDAAHRFDTKRRARRGVRQGPAIAHRLRARASAETIGR